MNSHSTWISTWRLSPGAWKMPRPCRMSPITAIITIRRPNLFDGILAGDQDIDLALIDIQKQMRELMIKTAK